MPAPVKAPLIQLPPDSKLGKALKRMLLRQQLRQSYYYGEITLEELNQKLVDAGIEKQYHIVSGHLLEIEDSFV